MITHPLRPEGFRVTTNAPRIPSIVSVDKGGYPSGDFRHLSPPPLSFLTVFLLFPSCIVRKVVLLSP